MVTGAQGFLGANAGIFLRDKSHTIGVARRGKATYFEHTRIHELADSQALATDIVAIKPDFLLHTAAVASHQLCQEHPELAHAINADATATIASACERAGTKLIYISTDSVFSGIPTNTRPAGYYSESDTTNPQTVYGETKLQGEINAQAETNPLIIRTNFFGWSPTHTRSILEFFVNSLSHNESVRGFTNITTTSLYVQTLMNYIWQLKNHSGVFHVTSQDALTKYEFGVAVAQRFGLDSHLIVAAESLDSKDISLSTDKLAQALSTSIEIQEQGIALANEQQLWQRGVST
jgi:dTDP-4-dehydrorhamnose reductase